MPQDLRRGGGSSVDTPKIRAKAMATKAVIYCRFSPRPGAAVCESNANQLQICREHCQRAGYSIVGEFSDSEVSGSEDSEAKRPGLWAAIAAVPRGGLLVVSKADRLARSVYLAEAIRRDLAKRRAVVEAVDGGREDNSTQAKLVRQILAAVAEAEREIIAARTSAAIKARLARGLAHGAHAPLGQKRVGQLLEADHAEAAAVCKVLELREAGKSYSAIARVLNSQGVKSRGQRWHHGGIRSICLRAGK